MPEKKEEKIDKVEITVEADNHRHAGEPCKRGDKIKVSPEVAEMLKGKWAEQKKSEK